MDYTTESKSLLAEKWTLGKTDCGFTWSWSHPARDAKTQARRYRGEITVVDMTHTDICALFLTPSLRPLWDSRIAGVEVKKYGKDSHLIYTTSKSSWPISPRDSLFLTYPVTFDKDLESYISVSKFTTDSSYPPCHPYVRANIHLSTLIMKPLLKGVHVTVLGQIDLGGAIPASLINLGQSHPLAFTQGLVYGRTHGIPPKIVVYSQEGYLISDVYDPVSKSYKIAFECSIDLKKRVRIDAKIYPDGVQFKVEGGDMEVEDGWGELTCRFGKVEVFIERKSINV